MHRAEMNILELYEVSFLLSSPLPYCVVSLFAESLTTMSENGRCYTLIASRRIMSGEGPRSR